ncbi:NADH-quinone oxidoreductase subunit NuoE [candidate division KSB1 bacterium]|nr:NADH-quinone oxidoreductase subunit NuoE [candidate division KSB1 bacterium]
MSTTPSPHVVGDKEYKLSQQLKDKITDLSAQYPEKNSVIIPALHLIQDEFGWVPPAAMRQMAQLLNIASNTVFGVASFYTMFNNKPVGRYHIQICRNIACSLNGSKELLEHIMKKLGIQIGEVSNDGKFSVSTVECLGACGSAPVMMVNDVYYENLTEKKVDQIIKSLE